MTATAKPRKILVEADKLQIAKDRIIALREAIGAWIRMGDGKHSNINAEYLVSAENVIESALFNLDQVDAPTPDTVLKALRTSVEEYYCPECKEEFGKHDQDWPEHQTHDGFRKITVIQGWILSELKALEAKK